MINPKLHLYLYQPAFVLKARVNMPGTLTYPLTHLTFDGVTVGAYTSVVEDMTLLLGTTEGGDDLGRTRVKGTATSTTIRIPRTSQGVQDGLLNVQDNAYITVLMDFRPWAKIPFFQDNGDGIDYKDGDVQVGTYNTHLPPVANTGPYMPGYIDSITGKLTVTFPAGGVDLSYVMADGATIATYAWDVKDGTITVGTSASAVITATFPAGKRWVSLTVVDSNGVPHTSYCFVLAIDPLSDPTLTHYQLQQNLGIDGQTLDIDVHETLSRTTYPDGTLVLFWWDEAASAGDRSHLKFTGWLDTEKYSTSRQKVGIKRASTLHATDIAGWLKQLPGFSQALYRTEELDAHSHTISPWSYMPTLDMSKMLWYVAFWHSNILSLADFFLPVGGTSYDTMRLDSSAASLFEQMAGLAQKLVPDFYITCNSQGQINFVRDWRLDDTGDRPIAGPILTEDDWNNLEVEYNRHPKYHVLRSGAVLVSTAFITVDGEETLPLVFSVAPGDTAAFGQGMNEQVESEGLAISQDELNICEGHRWALINSYYGNFTFTDPSRDLFWDYEPALYSRVQLNIGATYAAFRGLPFTQCTGRVEQIEVNYTASQRGSLIRAQVTFTKDEAGYPATMHIPDGTESVGYVPPTLYVTTPPGDLFSGQDLVAGIDSNSGSPGFLYRTANFTATTPTWERLLTLPDGTVGIFSFVVDPFSPGYINQNGTGLINGWVATASKIYRVTDIFGTAACTLQYTFANAISSAGSSSTRRKMHRTIQASFGAFFTTDADNPWLMCVSHYHNTSGHTGTWAVYSKDAGATWSSEIQISANYDSSASTGRPWMTPGVYLSPKTAGLAYTVAFTNTADPATADGYVSSDWGATWTAITNPDIQPNNGLAGGMHVPWHSNASDKLVYHGRITRGATLGYRLKRVELDGTTITDISPSNAGRTYGPHKENFGIRAYDPDNSYMVMGAFGNDTTANNSGDNECIFVSSNGGDTWTMVYGPLTWAQAFDGLGTAFAADNPDILYAWGGAFGQTATILYSSDFGVTWHDKSGNIHADWGVGGEPSGFVGICGGPIG